MWVCHAQLHFLLTMALVLRNNHALFDARALFQQTIANNSAHPRRNSLCDQKTQEQELAFNLLTAR